MTGTAIDGKVPVEVAKSAAGNLPPEGKTAVLDQLVSDMTPAAREKLLQAVSAIEKINGYDAVVQPLVLPSPQGLPPVISGEDMKAIGMLPGKEMGLLIRGFADLRNATCDSLEKLSAEIDRRRALVVESPYVLPPPLRVVRGSAGATYAHATTRYLELSGVDFWNVLREIIAVKCAGHASLNIHLPHEVQFDSFRNLPRAERFMNFADEVARLFGVMLVWENAPILNNGEWNILEQTTFVPKDRKLCLDIGHLMLGAANQDEALSRIDRFLEEHGLQILHLHLHVNDLCHDQHINDESRVREFLGEERFARLITNRSYIFEPSS